MDVVALVLAAGRGERLAEGRPKAEMRVAGRSLLAWSAGALGAARGVAGVLPVVGEQSDALVAALRADWRGPAQLLEAATGGATRQASLGCGLASLAEQAPEAVWVLVHDAARCLVEPADAEAVLAAAATSGAALPVLPIADTLKRLAGGQVAETLDRSALAAAQTPQAFRLAILREALEKAHRDGFLGTDCASLVERLGVPVAVCAGRAGNWKVTVSEDLARAEARLRARGVGP